MAHRAQEEMARVPSRSLAAVDQECLGMSAGEPPVRDLTARCDRVAHFVLFGPRGSTVSGRQTRKGLMPVVACANASTLVLNRFSQAFFVGKALSLPVSKVQPPEATGSSCHSTHAHSAEADVTMARNQSPMRSEAALLVIVFSLPPAAPKQARLQLAYLRVEPADGVRLERHLLNVAGRITARFEVVHVATDSLRQGVDVRGRREPALASGNGRLRRVDFEERLEHEPNDARHERVDDGARVGGQGPHDVVGAAEENLVDGRLRPFTACPALNSTRAHGFTDRVTHLSGDRLVGLAHSFSGAGG